MFEFLKKMDFTTKKYISNIFTFVMILLMSFSIYFLFIKNDFIRFKNSLEQFKIYEDLLKIQNDNLDNYYINLEKLVVFKKNNALLNEKIVNNKMASNYIIRLSDISKASNITEIEFEMTLAETVKLESLNDKPLIYPVKITGIGYYSDAINFISAISKLNNFYKITSIYIDKNNLTDEKYVYIELKVDIYGIDTLYND